MWIVGSTLWAYVILLIATFCSGTWPNFLRWVKLRRRAPLQVLFFDFYFTLCVVQLVTVLIVGNVGDQKPQLFTNLIHARGVKALAGLAGGVCMGFGVCLMMQAAPMAGQAISFPVTACIGTALGTMFTYMIEPKGNPALLALGTLFALLAVGCGALSHWEKGRQRRADAHAAGLPTPPDTPPDSPPPSPDLKMHKMEEGQSTTGYTLHETPDGSQSSTASTATIRPNYTRRGLILCVIAGLLFSGTAAFATLAQQGTACPTPAPAPYQCNQFEGLTPYATLMYQTLGTFLAIAFALPCMMSWPVNPSVAPMSPFKAYNMLTGTDHFLLVIGGITGALGNIGYFISVPKVGNATGFAILNTNPLIVALWGIFLWGEMRGKSINWKCRAWFGAMCVGFMISLVLIVLGGTDKKNKST